MRCFGIFSLFFVYGLVFGQNSKQGPSNITPLSFSLKGSVGELKWSSAGRFPGIIEVKRVDSYLVFKNEFQEFLKRPLYWSHDPKSAAPTQMEQFLAEHLLFFRFYQILTEHNLKAFRDFLLFSLNTPQQERAATAFQSYLADQRLVVEALLSENDKSEKEKLDEFVRYFSRTFPSKNLQQRKLNAKGKIDPESFFDFLISEWNHFKIEEFLKLYFQKAALHHKAIQNPRSDEVLETILSSAFIRIFFQTWTQDQNKWPALSEKKIWQDTLLQSISEYYPQKAMEVGLVQNTVPAELKNVNWEDLLRRNKQLFQILQKGQNSAANSSLASWYNAQNIARDLIREAMLYYTLAKEQVNVVQNSDGQLEFPWETRKGLSEAQKLYAKIKPFLDEDQASPIQIQLWIQKGSKGKHLDFKLWKEKQEKTSLKCLKNLPSIRINGLLEKKEVNAWKNCFEGNRAQKEFEMFHFNVKLSSYSWPKLFPLNFQNKIIEIFQKARKDQKEQAEQVYQLSEEVEGANYKHWVFYFEQAKPRDLQEWWPYEPYSQDKEDWTDPVWAYYLSKLRAQSLSHVYAFCQVSPDPIREHDTTDLPANDGPPKIELQWQKGADPEMAQLVQSQLQNSPLRKCLEYVPEGSMVEDKK